MLLAEDGEDLREEGRQREPRGDGSRIGAGDRGKRVAESGVRNMACAWREAVIGMRLEGCAARAAVSIERVTGKVSRTAD